MDRDSDRQKSFTRRTAVLATGKLSLLGLLMGRMYYLQVLESDQYQILAEENRINMRLLAPPRGGRTPKEAGLKLMRPAVRPKRSPLLTIKLDNRKYESWKTFLNNAYWSVDLK